MRAKYLPDRPLTSSESDRLGFESAAEGMLEHIAVSEPPFTWGIFGDWGSGKTSLMHLIECKMEKRLTEPPTDPNVPVHIPVWFDAWRYENEVNIVYPLFHAIRKDFTRRCASAANADSFFSSFKRVATASLLGLTDLALRAATNKTFGDAASLEDVTKWLKLAEEGLPKVFSKWADENDDVQKAFADFARTYVDVYRSNRKDLRSRTVHLAIFVDDLDRCLPDVAITILERIKNHLSVDNCVFILGVNRNVVYQSIRKKYDDLNIDGRQHLEKIIQYSIGVPEPTQKDLRRFVVESIRGLVIQDGHPAEPDLSNYYTRFADALYDCHFTNPRKIKRILNRYLTFLEHGLAAGSLSKYKIPNVARLIVMREYYSDLYDLFSEAGFASLKVISRYDGKEEGTRKFLEDYGSKWQRLVASFELYKGIASMEDTVDLTTKQYDDSIRRLFGRED